MTIFLNMSNSFVQDTNYAYNYELSGDVVTSKIVYSKSDNKLYLSPKFKYNYTYDCDGYLTRKEILQWSPDEYKWVKSYCLNYTPLFSEYRIELALWDEKEGDYSKLKERYSFFETTEGELSVHHYKWNIRNCHWVLKNDITMSNNYPLLTANRETQQVVIF